MNRKTSIIMSLSISAVLVAAAIWFLYELRHRLGFLDGQWRMPHQAMMGGGYMGIFMILFWAVIIAAIALMVFGAISGRPSSRNECPPVLPDALEILKRRYANGEIDKARYEAMKQEIDQ